MVKKKKKGGIFEKLETKTLLSTLWIFALINYLYCDVIGLIDPVLHKEILSGTIEGGIKLTENFLLGASIMMEVPIIMIILSRVLKYNINRWVNIFAGLMMTIVQAMSLTLGAPTSYYIFFSVIEISTTVLIVWVAWNWAKGKK